MSRSWADMQDSPTSTPLSPISPPPIPYRQPSYFVAKEQGSLSPPILAPPAKSPPPLMQSEEKVEQEDDGGWGEDADSSAHQKRMKKFQKKLGPPGSYVSQPQRAFPPPQQQQQQQFQPMPNPQFQNQSQGQGQFQPYQQREQFRPPPAQNQRDFRGPPPQQYQQPHQNGHYQQQHQQQQQDQYAQTPSFVDSDGPVVVNIPKQQNQASLPSQAENGSAPLPNNQNSTLPTVDGNSSPAESSPRSFSRNGQSINMNSGAVGRIQQLLGTTPKPRQPRPSAEAPPFVPIPPSQTSQPEQTPTPSTPVVPVQPASHQGGAYTGPVDQRFGGEGMDSNRAVLANPKRWGAAPAVPAETTETKETTEVKEPEAAVSAETPAEVLEQGKEDEESDGGWGETTEAADMPKKSVAETPVTNGEAPTKNGDKPPSDGGWGEDAPAPTPITAPIPQKSAIGDWAAETQSGAPQEDMGPDGGWVTDPRVHHWIRSTTPVAQPPVIPSKAHQDPSFATSPPSNSAITDPSVARDRSISSDSPIAKLMDSAEYDTILPAFGYKEDPEAIHQEDVKRQQWEDTNRQYRSEYKWKRDPHPAFSARFVNQRLLVRFPFPIRTEAIRPTMYDHFSKYGHIRVTWNHEPRTPETADQVILAFDTSKAVDDCLADPTHTSCLVKSSALGRSDVVAVKIKVSRTPLHITAKTVYVKFLGPRVGDNPEGSTPKMNVYGQPIPSLPADIFLDAIPVIKRGNGKIEWWARVRPSQMSFEDVNSRSLAETGIRAEQITLLDMSTRVPEKDIIEKLGWYFSDVMGVVPHPPSNGWLINNSNAAPARALMSEIRKIPGMMARLATPAEDMLYRQATEVPEEEAVEQPKEDMEPVQVDTAEPEPIQPPQPTVKEPIQPVQPASAPVQPPKSQVAIPKPASPSPIVQASPLSSRDTVHPTKPAQSEPEPVAANLPLQKRLMPTYRGRILREDRSGYVPKFYDDAAIFVSNLPKESETDSSLFRRFSQYGTVCGVVYRPELSRSEFASAKVLFGSKAAADKAMKAEHGSDSFGSTIKVEKRRVLPNDVQLEEKYVDDQGRAHSPTMASQYSPPLPPVEEDDTAIQPAPLVTAPPSAPTQAPMGLVWMPLPAEWTAQHAPNGSSSVIYALCAAPGGTGKLPVGLPPLPTESAQAVEPSTSAAATETSAAIASPMKDVQTNGDAARSVPEPNPAQSTSQNYHESQPKTTQPYDDTPNQDVLVPSQTPPSDSPITIQSPKPVPTGPSRQFNHSSQYQNQGQGPNGNNYNRYQNGNHSYSGPRDYPSQQSFNGQGPHSQDGQMGASSQGGGRWQHDLVDAPADGGNYPRNDYGGRGGYGPRGSFGAYNNHYNNQGRGGGSGGYSNHGGSSEGRGYNDYGQGQGGMGRGGGGEWFGRGGRGGGSGGPGSGSDRGRY